MTKLPERTPSPNTPESNSHERLAHLKEQLEEIPYLAFIPKLREEIPEAEIYLTGGAVRDALLGKDSSQFKDFDFIVRGVPREKLIEFLENRGKLKDVQARAFGVIKFTPTGFEGELLEPIEIALPRVEAYHGGGKADVTVKTSHELPLEDDLARRDYTINAMAYNPQTGELIDPFDGQADLQAKIVRAVRDPYERFGLEDPSRILRGLRFACTLDFEIEPQTWQAMFKMAPEIFSDRELTLQVAQELRAQGRGVPKELFYHDEFWQRYQEKIQALPEAEREKRVARVATEVMAKEFIKGFAADPLRMLELMRQTDLLYLLIPELVELMRVEQPPQYHKFDVWQHTLETLKNLPSTADINLKIAALLHDIAKPQTKGYSEEKSRITFHNHDKVGAQIASSICHRLRLNSLPRQSDYYVDISQVSWLIENHIRAYEIPKMLPVKQERLLTGKRGENLIELLRADRLASDGDTKICDKLTEIRNHLKEKGVAGDLLNGREIMEILGLELPAGGDPRLGGIKQALRNAQLAGEIANPEEAEGYLRQFLIRSSKFYA